MRTKEKVDAATYRLPKPRFRLYMVTFLLIATAVGLVAVLVARSTTTRSSPLSVTFLDWTNVAPPSTEAFDSTIGRRYGIPIGTQFLSRSGDCAMLQIDNNTPRYRCFEALSVEYQTTNGWVTLVPTNWPWFRGTMWSPKKGATAGGRALAIPRPAEVPATSAWRVYFVSYLDKAGLPTNHPRIHLNQAVSRILGPKTLLFYAPVRAVTPVIPPMDSLQRNSHGDTTF
jgi:hypothetical protein